MTFYVPPPPFVGGSQPLAPHLLSPSLESVPANNPPFQNVSRAAVALVAAAITWQAPDPQPQQRRTQIVAILGAAPANNPPFSPGYNQPAYMAALWAWQPPDPAVGRPPLGVPQGLQPVPFYRPWLNPTLATWAPPDPWPQQHINLSPALTSVAVNMPPIPRSPALPGVVAAWRPPDPWPQQKINLAPAVLAVRVDSPPPRSAPNGILAAWTPPPPPIQIRLGIVGVLPPPRVDTPPGGFRPWLSALIGSWQPPDPTPRQHRTSFTPSAAAPSPPPPPPIPGPPPESHARPALVVPADRRALMVSRDVPRVLIVPTD